uniref:Uncharacterized protein n=1 Tax=Arundo donax TaxID=35708 RepID=A0A0A9FIU2_ARUDO
MQVRDVLHASYWALQSRIVCFCEGSRVPLSEDRHHLACRCGGEVARGFRLRSLHQLYLDVY